MLTGFTIHTRCIEHLGGLCATLLRNRVRDVSAIHRFFPGNALRLSNFRPIRNCYGKWGIFHFTRLRQASLKLLGSIGRRLIGFGLSHESLAIFSFEYLRIGKYLYFTYRYLGYFRTGAVRLLDRMLPLTEPVKIYSSSRTMRVVRCTY